MKATWLWALAGGACVAFASFAQQYRWVDEQGQVHYSDSPPRTAERVERLDLAPPEPAPPQPPFALTRAQQQFPVTLYTSPNCQDVCRQARDLLNRRGIPFTEVLVWDDDTDAALKKIAGASEVPTMVVGRTVQRGFEAGLYEALLDSAGYPTAGVLPERSQSAPDRPAGHFLPSEVRPVAEPVETVEPERLGPYDPGGLEATGKPRPGQYDPSELEGPPPRAGQYRVPGGK